MSKVGKKVIELPSGVTLTKEGNMIQAAGSLGKESTEVDEIHMAVEVEGNLVTVSPKSESKTAKMIWGTQRANIANIVKGVSEGFKIVLDINGVGYRANVQGTTLTLALGYSHDVVFPIPAGIKIECPKPTQIIVSGTHKQTVGQVAAKIRGFRPPEPYKGKGIKYEDEIIVRKEGKKK